MTNIRDMFLNPGRVPEMQKFFGINLAALVDISIEISRGHAKFCNSLLHKFYDKIYLWVFLDAKE